MYHLLSDGKRIVPCFWMEKKEDELGKNKAVTPRITFPFFLKTPKKKGIFQKKNNYAFAIIE